MSLPDSRTSRTTCLPGYASVRHMGCGRRGAQEMPGNGTTLRVASLCREFVGTYQSEVVQIRSPHLNLRTDPPMVHVVEVMA